MFALLTQQLDKNTTGTLPLLLPFQGVGVPRAGPDSGPWGELHAGSGIPECAHAVDHYQQAGISCLPQGSQNQHTRV